MNILVLGSGGREHALVWRLAADPDVREFYLGTGGAGESKGFRGLKHYKRRKRWLS